MDRLTKPSKTLSIQVPSPTVVASTHLAEKQAKKDQALLKTSDLDQLSVDGIITRVVDYIDAGQCHLALKVVDKVLPRYSEHITLKVCKGWCLHRLGRSDEADPWMRCAMNGQTSDEYVVSRVQDYCLNREYYVELINLCHFGLLHHSQKVIMWQRLGMGHYRLGEYRSAIYAYRQSLALAPNPKIVFNFSLALLAHGDYREGFNLYKARIDSNPEIDWVHSKGFPVPLWRGESLTGRSLLIWAEQGFGDTIQFCRLAVLLAQQGVTVDIILPPSQEPLFDLLQHLDAIRTVYKMDNGTIRTQHKHDFHCPLLNLLSVFPITREKVPAKVPYLTATTAHYSQWDVIQSLKGLKVGLVWSSNPHQFSSRLTVRNKSHKSMALADCLPLFALKNTCFVSLQLNTRAEEKALLNEHGVLDMEEHIRDFSDTAAIIHHLDIVVSIDTSVLHLAGAMAIPCLGLLHSVADWRWQNNRDDCPWYPTMRLCRQVWPGTWSDVIQRASRHIEQLANQMY